jgi:hypothetical protein
MITVYAKTIERAAKDDSGLIDGDLQIVEDTFDGYIDWLEDKLIAQFGRDRVTVDYHAHFGPCYHATKQNEHHLWHDLPSFWEWYN